MSAVAPLPLPDTWFDRTTAVHRRSPGTYVADLDESWSSLTGIHGGSMLAMAVRAAEDGEPGRPVRTVTASFVRPGRPGPAVLRVEPVRRGRSLTTLDVVLEQQDRPVLTARATLVDRRPGLPWERVEPSGIAPVEACVPLEPPAEAGLVPHFDHATARLDPAHVPFSRSADARVGGHVRPLEPRPIDTPWLAMILDWFPPAPFTRLDPPAGGVSIDLTVHVHRTRPPLAEHEWLEGSFRADASHGGLALEHGRIADGDGTLLAESFHTRWTG
jgi:acyl-CoA thioesterase